jgi:hypothetical protein
MDEQHSYSLKNTIDRGYLARALEKKDPAEPVTKIQWEYAIDGSQTLADIIYDDSAWIAFPDQYSTNIEFSYITHRQRIHFGAIFDLTRTFTDWEDATVMLGKIFGGVDVPLRITADPKEMVMINDRTGEKRFIRRRELLFVRPTGNMTSFYDLCYQREMVVANARAEKWLEEFKKTNKKI